MKKIIGMLLSLIVVILGVCYFSTSTEKIGKETADFLRIHIRANSNENVDQTIKYKIKDEVVNYLTPYIADCENKDNAISVISKNKKDITNLVDNYLQNNNYKYKCNVKICNEYFPTRSYDNVVLNSGFYDAIIIELGSAQGANWWCVMYPPLCFSNFNSENGLNIEYKSKILQIIRQFFN